MPVLFFVLFKSSKKKSNNFVDQRHFLRHPAENVKSSFGFYKLTHQPKMDGTYNKKILELFPNQYVEPIKAKILKQYRRNLHDIRDQANLHLENINLPRFYRISKSRLTISSRNQLTPNLVSSIFVDDVFILISIIDLRKKRILKSSILKVDEIFDGMFDEKLRRKQYFVVNNFYNIISDKLCLFLEMRESPMDRVLDFRRTSPNMIIKKLSIEVGKFFESSKREIKWKIFSEDEKINIDHGCKTILSRSQNSKELNFSLISYQGVKTSKIGWRISKHDPLLKSHHFNKKFLGAFQISDSKLLYIEDGTIFLLDQKSESVSDLRKYSHLKIDPKSKRVMTRDGYIFFCDSDGSEFQIFEADRKLGQINLVKELSLYPQPGLVNFVPKLARFFEILRLKNHNFLLILDKKPLENHDFTELKKHFDLVEFDSKSSKIVKKDRIFVVNDPFFRESMFVLDDKDDIFLIKYFRNTVYLQLIQRGNGKEEKDPKISKYTILMRRNMSIFGTCFIQPNKLVLCTSNDSILNKLVVLEMKIDPESHKPKLEKLEAPELNIKNSVVIKESPQRSQFITVAWAEQNNDLPSNVSQESGEGENADLNTSLRLYDSDLNLVKKFKFDQEWIQATNLKIWEKFWDGSTLVFDSGSNLMLISTRAQDILHLNLKSNCIKFLKETSFGPTWNLLVSADFLIKLRGEDFDSLSDLGPNQFVGYDFHPGAN